MRFPSPEGHNDLQRISALSLIGVALATPLHDALNYLEIIVLTQLWLAAVGIKLFLPYAIEREIIFERVIRIEGFESYNFV